MSHSSKTANALRTIIFIALSFVFSTESAQAASARWTIKKTQWTATDEKNYSLFISALGNSGCNTVDGCLKNPANPYRSSDPKGAFFDADCGKFAYLLRAYFAWKNDLPFSYANSVRSSDGAGSDIRYSPNGNVITSRRDLTIAQDGQSIDGYRVLKTMQGEVDTAMYRVHPSRDGVGQGLFSDFYSIQIQRDQVRPGSVIYDAAGHVVVVYKIETDGRVRYFDAHPDKTVSHGVFGEKFARSRPGSAAGFKNFRSLYLVNATQGEQGDWIGGTVTAQPLLKTPGYSLEQYFGTETRLPYKDSQWTRARYVVSGQTLNWFDFVRTRLAIGELKYHPVEEMQNAMQSLCGDIQDRAISIDTALASGIQNRAHPERLPLNIFGTDGDWEESSSPSRDARLKTSFKEVRDRVQQMVEMYRAGDNRVVYKGADLAGDLRNAYATAAATCTVRYRRSNGSTVRLDYDAVLKRLFELSFDPYNCAELRWGATDSAELATCADGADKQAWFRAEQRLRNQLDRTYNTKMGFSLQDLLAAVPGSGVDQAPDVDLKGYLNRL